MARSKHDYLFEVCSEASRIPHQLGEEILALFRCILILICTTLSARALTTGILEVGTGLAMTWFQCVWYWSSTPRRGRLDV